MKFLRAFPRRVPGRTRLYEPSPYGDLLRAEFFDEAPVIELALGSGSFSLAGDAAGFAKTTAVFNDSGSLVVEGRSTTIALQYALPIATGNHAVAGHALGLEVMLPSYGLVSWAGLQYAELVYGALSWAEVEYASLAYAGVSWAEVEYGTATFQIAAAPGSYVIAGGTAALEVTRPLELTTGALLVNGDATLVAAVRGLSLQEGAYSVEGTDVALAVGSDLILSTGAYHATGRELGLHLARTLPMERGAFRSDGHDLTFSVIRISARRAVRPEASGNNASLAGSANHAQLVHLANRADTAGSVNRT